MSVILRLIIYLFIKKKIKLSFGGSQLMRSFLIIKWGY